LTLGKPQNLTLGQRGVAGRPDQGDVIPGKRRLEPLATVLLPSG
jgi:hypothetical protein